MTPVRLRCFLPMVILVSAYAHGSGVKTVDLSSGRRSGSLPIVADLDAGAAEGSEVEYVENGLEPLYDFLIQLRLHKLCKLLQEARLEDVLLNSGPLTIFAPTDGSFVFLPGGKLEEIRRDPQRLGDFILHHIVAGDISSQQIQDEMVVSSLTGYPLRFNIYGSPQVYTVSGAQILTFDLPFELGRLHIIDHPLYLFPETNMVGELQTTNSRLYRLLESTEVANFLSGISGTYTIFAPDDSAFDYLSQDFLDTLNRNQSLAEKILLNHVVHGSVYTRGITNGMQLESVGGALLTFTESRGLIFVNGVPIVLPDIPVLNGVIHMINRVLLPEDIDTDCHCKSSRSGTVSNVPSRTTTGQGGTTGVSRQPQVPGTRVRTEQPQRPTGQTGQRGPGRPNVGGQVQGPGSHITGTQPQTPGSSQRESPRPGSPWGAEVQRPESPFGTGHPQTPESTFGTRPGERPGSPFGTGQPQTPGSAFGTGPGQRPGSTFGTGQPQAPGSTFGTGSSQRPGSSFGTGQPHTPDSTQGVVSPQRPGSSFGTGQPQVPEGTLGTGHDQRPGSHITKGQTQRRGPSQRPGSTPVSGYPQRPGDEIREPQRPGSSVPQRPGSSTGVGQPQRPGGTVGTRQPQRAGNVFEPGYPGISSETEQQTPGGTFGTGQPQQPGSVSGTGIAAESPDERPYVPGRTKVNKPVRIPLPPPPTRAPASHHTRTTSYPGSQQRGSSPSVGPQDDSSQFGGSPGSNVREPYRPTRAPPTSVSHGSRYPVPGGHQRVTPARRPQVTAVYPDSPHDSITEAPEVLQPGRGDTRKQPSTQTHPQSGRHRTPQPTGRITPRPTVLPQTQRPFVGQIRPVPTRAPVTRTTYRPTTNCRQSGDRITSSNRNFPLCSPQDVNQEPCQSIDQPYDPSDPRPACPGPDFDQGCRDPLQQPAINDRRPACRVPQRKPDCRKRNERPDNRPLCPDTSRNCRLPEEPDNPSNPLPLCQEIFSVEGCRRPYDPYDPQDRRPECPPDDCRPPQEPLRRGDTRPLCTVNEEDSIRQPLASTTARPPYPQQPRPGSQLPETPGAGQHRPGKQPSQGTTPVGGRPQTPSWQRPQTQPHSPRQPIRPEPLTTRKPGKQPGEFGQPISPDDNDALLSPIANPPGHPAYPGSTQSHRRQGQPSPGINDPSSPQTVGRGTTSVQPQIPEQSRPGRPHSTQQRPPGQVGEPHSTAQRPPAQSGRPYPGPRQPIIHVPPPPPSRGSQPSSSPGSPSAVETGGDDSARSLLDIVQDPGLQIKGHPVKLTIVLGLFEKAGLIDVLEGPGPSTVFLPSDDAFKKLPRGVVEQLEENPDLLRQVLLYHVISHEVRPTGQETSITVPTRQGMSLVITMLKGGRLILIGGAKAVAVTRASNGIFYVINELLYPLPHEDIVSALKTRPDLTQVTSLIQQSGLANMLTGSNPFTLFAPTDAAFAALPQGTLQEITRNNTALRELLLAHIVEGAHFGREFLAGGIFPNARGGKLRFKVLSYGYTVNDANIKTPEIVTGTGVIHLVDQVLLEPEDLPSVQEQPQSVSTGGANVVRIDSTGGNYENYPEITELARGMGLNRFLTWITSTGLIEKVHDGGSYTILAPTDAAVNSLPDNMVQAIDSDPDQVRPLLKFHIITQHVDWNNIRNEQTASTLLPDKRVRFNVYQEEGQGKVVTACGVPIGQAQGTGSVRLIAVNQALYPPSGNLAHVLEASPILQNLAGAIRTFHLSWMLNGQGPTTIFAPSDAAFEALSDEDRKNLIENRQAFTDLLKRHIVKGTIFSTGIQDGMQVRNEKRETVTFSVHPGGISINSIPISYSDVTATNGVLHVIDHFM